MGKAGEILAHELPLRGGYVVTVDDSLGDLPEGDVLIQDDQIVAVGRNVRHLSN